MVWSAPLNLTFVPSADSLSFAGLSPTETSLPLAPHPGAFGVARKNHIHEGVDLYCAEGTPVYAVEPGRVVAVVPFTGTIAGSDWWHDTYAVLVEGETGVVVYGEITPGRVTGENIAAGDCIGHVKQVLKNDKGRPMAMLHLELYDHGTRDAVEWKNDTPRPRGLRDPTPYLLNIGQIS